MTHTYTYMVFIMWSIEELVHRAQDTVRDFHKLQTLINDTKYELEFEFNIRSKRYVVKERTSIPMAFFGDIHGDINTLVELMIKLNAVEYLNSNSMKMVFLGDYIDRGPQQLLTLTFLSILKCEWRENILLLRGNHEPVKGLEPYPHDFPYELVERFGSDGGRELYYSFLEMFEAMPLLLYIPGRILAFHGGPPLSRAERYTDPDTILNVGDKEDFEDVLWSDPTEDIEGVSYNVYRGAGKLWGWRISERIVEKLDIKVMIRGHEPCNGFKINHRGMVVTLFSMKGYYGNESAAALRIPYDDNSWLSNIASYILLL